MVSSLGGGSMPISVVAFLLVMPIVLNMSLYLSTVRYGVSLKNAAIQPSCCGKREGDRGVGFSRALLLFARIFGLRANFARVAFGCCLLPALLVLNFKFQDCS